MNAENVLNACIRLPIGEVMKLLWAVPIAAQGRPNQESWRSHLILSLVYWSVYGGEFSRDGRLYGLWSAYLRENGLTC